MPQDGDTLYDDAPFAADGTWSIGLDKDMLTNNNDDYQVCIDYPPTGAGGAPSGYRDECFRGADSPETTARPATIVQFIPGLDTTGVDAALTAGLTRLSALASVWRCRRREDQECDDE